MGRGTPNVRRMSRRASSRDHSATLRFSPAKTFGVKRLEIGPACMSWLCPCRPPLRRPRRAAVTIARRVAGRPFRAIGDVGCAVLPPVVRVTGGNGKRFDRLDRFRPRTPPTKIADHDATVAQAPHEVRHPEDGLQATTLARRPGHDGRRRRSIRSATLGTARPYVGPHLSNLHRNRPARSEPTIPLSRVRAPEAAPRTLDPTCPHRDSRPCELARCLQSTRALVPRRAFRGTVRRAR